jgi:hypothetical protein
MSHIDDLQRLLDTDLAMEFLLRQCVKPLFNTLCIMSYHIARYRYTSLSSHSIMYQSYGQDKFIFGWSPTRVFQAHTKRPLWHFTLCDAVRCCAFVPWERKTWEQVGENERYIHSCNSRWWRGECQLTCSFGWFLSGSTHCTFSLTQVQRVHVVDADETKIE